MATNLGETISCVIMPMRSTGGLLLPSSAMIEVIDSRDINVVVDLQAGIIGKMQWKNITIPFLSYETAAGLLQAAFNKDTKAAVIRVPVENSALKYMAIAAYGVPKVVQISRGQMKEVLEEDRVENNIAADRIQIDGQLIWVPDMQALVDHVAAQAA